MRRTGFPGRKWKEDSTVILLRTQEILVTPRVRAMVAYVASRLVSGAESSFIFDFSGPGHRSMGGTVNEKCVNVYDFSENCQLTGNFSAGSFQLFHHGERVHISLEIVEESVRGFDLGTGR